MQKMRFPLDINFREFEGIIRQRFYGVFDVLPENVRILFIYADGDDFSFFVKFTSSNGPQHSLYVHLQFDVKVSDYIYNITDLSVIKKSVLKQVSAR